LGDIEQSLRIPLIEVQLLFLIEEMHLMKTKLRLR